MTTVTRFNVFARPATEDEDDREVVRLFEKRKLVGEFDTADIQLEDWEDKFTAFLNKDAKGNDLKAPRTLAAAMDFLSKDADEDEGDGEAPGSIVPEKYRILYGSDQNCGDAIALALTAFVTLPRSNPKNPDGGLDRAKLRAVAEVNGIGDKLARWEDNGLNGGLLRMNTSNVLRGMNRRGEQVVIGLQTWEAREVEKKARKRSAKKATA